MSEKKAHTFVASLTGRTLGAVLATALCCALMAGYAAATYSVNVMADGDVIPVKTSLRNADAIIAKTNIAVGKNDKVDLSAFRVGGEAADGNAIIVYRALPVKITETGKKTVLVEAAGTIADALEKADIELKGADTTIPSPDTLLKKNMKIKIVRGYKITLIADGVKQKVDYAVGTVSDVLKREGIKLGESDVVKPALSATLKKGSVIRIKRISYETREVEKPVKYQTLTKTSSVLVEGSSRVAREGKNGVKIVTYEDKVVDGEVVSSKKLGETLKKKAVDKVVVKGSRKKASSSSNNIAGAGAPTSYIKTFHGPATAYTGGGTTASGAAARVGLVAVNPRQIPYGSKLYIVADDGTVYGYCTAADTGGFVTNGSGTLVDLYMDSEAQCRQWGRRNVTIYVISWG